MVKTITTNSRMDTSAVYSFTRIGCTCIQYRSIINPSRMITPSSYTTELLARATLSSETYISSPSTNSSLHSRSLISYLTSRASVDPHAAGRVLLVAFQVLESHLPSLLIVHETNACFSNLRTRRKTVYCAHTLPDIQVHAMVSTYLYEPVEMLDALRTRDQMCS